MPGGREYLNRCEFRHSGMQGCDGCGSSGVVPWKPGLSNPPCGNREFSAPIS
ncbi:hypothetical protein HMPREF0762_01622 [Slackia exigua ATCC 700122]|uniref:Uncharacterized protein n=1 Tax=Slackia exigua (strain ATCC 700122 / DSM 15923 / CIP 105133 / JCM 11022 / KCTC 5966 / S-7) TaxID=649764 RepID=D0WIE7_SLAES|nr:hypothetical protein HMPREF0762_01622 [Slackia exigua ATCC 700122]